MVLINLFSFLVGHLTHERSSHCFTQQRQRLASCIISLKNQQSSIAEEIIGWNEEIQSIFVKNYFQKRPVLFRNAFPNIETLVPLDKSDYFELATDEDVESRLFQKKGKKWKKSYGPFRTRKLQLLPDKEWTILIQEVDRHVPLIADLWCQGFQFVPSWRRDDIMISYSLPGGGIGAHVDNYDVFLLQGSGTREWAIENSFVSEQEERRREVRNVETKLLRDFRADQSWVMNPGDMLYIPPRVPHRGTTLGDKACTTISLGFRTPNYKNLITAYWDEVSTTTLTGDNSFYEDVEEDLMVPPRGQVLPGRVSVAAKEKILEEIKGKFLSKAEDEEWFEKWLGKYLTQPLRGRLRSPSPFFLKISSEVEKEATFIDETGRGDFDEPADDYEDDEWEEEEDRLPPLAVRGPHRVASPRMFSSGEEVIDSVRDGSMVLRRAEGQRVAYFQNTFFVDGMSFSIPKLQENDNSEEVSSILCDNLVINANDLNRIISTTERNRFFVGLLRLGIYYPVDVRA